MKPTTLLFVFTILAFSLAFSGTISASIQESDENFIQENIRKYISELEGSGTIKLAKQKIIGNPVITDLYKNEDYQPVWTNASNRKDLIVVLEDSYFEGLNPEDYHIDFIKEHEG